MKKIELKKDLGPIVFLGSMNAMPMMYALELKKKGFDVLYFVDVPCEDKLSRPEHHFTDIKYPYPDWIIEMKLKTQILLPFSRRSFLKAILNKIKEKTDKEPQLFFLNGFFISLSPFIRNSRVLALSHGSDLNMWADIDEKKQLANAFKSFSIFKFIPNFIAKKIIPMIVDRQYFGFLKSDLIVYFPKGFHQRGDDILEKLEKSGKNIYRRYDISFELLKNEKRDFKKRTNKLVILSAVRFTYEKFVNNSENCSKGNDLIIKGLALYYKENKNIEIHFVEKGRDVNSAKKLCIELGLASVIQWHKEMEFYKLLDLYRESDICFDQLGDHWIGAIGAYAMYLGKPLIANDQAQIKTGLWPEINPVLSAKNEFEVCTSLKYLESEANREETSLASKVFAEQYFSPNKFINDVFIFDLS